MKKKRVFVGIKASPGLKEEIVNFSKSVLNNEKIRTIEPENLHITLTPPWYEKNLKKVKEKLTPLEKLSSFEIEFEKIEVGPSKKHPRLIWATGKAGKNIKRLKEKTESLLNKKGEKRPFFLHLTIARFKRKDFSKISFKKTRWDFYWKEEIESVDLFESRLLQSGAEYKILSTFELKR